MDGKSESGKSGSGDENGDESMESFVGYGLHVLIFASPPDPNNSTAIVDFMRQTWLGNAPATNGTTAVSGTWTIAGTYCAPRPGQAAKLPHSTLEVLIHGITYNHSMWAGLGFPRASDPNAEDHIYNWHAYANSRGYATLALDRLGHGSSPQRPDPLTVVQPQLQVEILHQIIAAVRSASSPYNALHQAFERVVIVGHSYGSYVGAALAAQHPADAEAAVLTGYSNYYNFTDVINAEWVPAAQHDPARLGANLPKGYVTMAREEDRTRALYAGAYDPAIPPVDFASEDTLTVGEIGALGAILGDAVGYTGHVLVVTAVEDAFFCEPPKATCEAHLASTASSFPDAASYSYFAPENTGHDLTLHYSSKDTFERVHDWLDEKLCGEE
ncbi:putative cardiolipin-specific deacylase, mitochondrial [Achaetomium macrosporum]|uniref:Cardiolipin-specific deacylase, mitochondrial n=1 Tax=Achaetomium macrosporum TaxID=79813 RepID=A0AAN7C351_9PEZI|nr:putative cardiolipin-specific deacylase, mitochondrial [Achaetomium macrosporum]